MGSLPMFITISSGGGTEPVGITGLVPPPANHPIGPAQSSFIVHPSMLRVESLLSHYQVLQGWAAVPQY